tara:strand:- start:1658 stop:3592 length:1935 start_codon:yes stop_codon:yes gene_type:complete
MMGPMGVMEPVWRCSGVHVHQAGGFKARLDVADTSKGLQVSLWINDSANNDHRLYVGSEGVNTLAGSYNSNPYFKASFGLPKPNKWYLLVAVFHPEGYQGGETGRSGVYDPETGEKVGAVTEFALTSANSQILRAFRYAAETADTYAYFARPRVEVINGEEMSIGALLGRIPNDGTSAINFYTSAGEFTRNGVDYVKQTGRGWNTGISSKETFVHATASARISSTAQVMLGLSYTSCQGDYNNLNYAIYSSDGELAVYENGSLKGWFGTVSGANRLSVVWDGVSVKYYKDATLIYTSATKPTAPVLFDLCAYETGDIFAEPLFAATGSGGEKGLDGTRGSVEVQVATSTGAWSNTTANNAVPNGIPVEHDRVTIYKASDPAVQTIKRYNGSAWVSYTLYVHGSALIEDTLDAKVVRAGTTMTAPVIDGGIIRGGKVELKGTKYMKIQASTPFGPDGLIEWYGPIAGNVSAGNVIYNNLTKTNATTYVDDDGSPYFGGTIIAGTLTTSVQSPSLSNIVSLDTDIFGSNGKQIAVVCSATCSGSSGITSGTCSTDTSNRIPSVELKLYQVSSSGAETLVKLEQGSGTFHCSSEGNNSKIETFGLGKSFTYFDNQLSTANRQYRLKATFTNTFGNKNQRISIVTQEA